MNYPTIPRLTRTVLCRVLRPQRARRSSLTLRGLTVAASSGGAVHLGRGVEVLAGGFYDNGGTPVCRDGTAFRLGGLSAEEALGLRRDPEWCAVVEIVSTGDDGRNSEK